MWKTSLRNQIIVFSALLVLMTSAMSLFSFWWSTSTYNAEKVTQDIDSARNVYEQYLQAKERLLVTAARVLTADFGFKTAVATRDADTITSVLNNHAQRINADLMILTNPHGQLISSTTLSLPIEKNMHYVVEELLKSQFGARFIQFNGQLYQVILMPVRAPRVIAYTLIGFLINDAVSHELKQLTGMEVSFLVKHNQVVSTSLDETDKQHAYEYVTHHRQTGLLRSRIAYINRTLELNGLPAAPVEILLSDSLAASYKQFDQMLWHFLILAAIAIIICLLLSRILARNMTEPLSRLVLLAQQFARGEYRHATASVRSSSEVRELFNTFTDMGDEIRHREQLIRYQATHDKLTDLYNRHAMHDLIEQAVSKQRPFLLLSMDIKGLKQINDKLGPQLGDECIQTVAQRLVNYHQDDSTAHGRIGGDEFLTLLPIDEHESDIAQIKPLLACLNAPYAIRDLQLTLQFSCGVARYPEDASDGKVLLRRATMAADLASNNHQALRFYQQGEDEAYLQRIAIVEELKQALQEDDGSVFMYYQPKLNTRTGKVEKVEALIRWINKDGDFVPPDLFIELAERAGLIINLTHWVINCVVRQIAAWRDDGLAVKVAINVSAQDLSHQDFMPTLLRALEYYQVLPDALTIELTERDMMENEQHGIAAITALKAQGFTISVDDYGIGQSSLSKLKQLPLHELKIDKSFILKLDSSPDDQIIVKSTIALGHNLGLVVVAEGVENQPSMDLLIEMGCDHLQGYHLSKPLPADKLTTWLIQHDTYTNHH